MVRRSPAEIAALNAAQRKPDVPVGVDALAKAIEGLEKLPGKPGAAGKNGLRGPIGPPGEFVAGPPGSPGRDGIDGLPGKNGKSITGPRGLQGEPGQDGVGPDEKVKLDAVDPEAGYLEDKLEPGLGVKFRRSKTGKAIVIDATGGGGGVRVSGGGGAHPNLAAHDALGLATDDALAAHALIPHGGGGSDDQTAAEVPFTPAGGIAATDVQAAIEEVAADAGSGDIEEVLTEGNDAGGLDLLNVGQVTVNIPTGTTEPGIVLTPSSDQWHAAIRVDAGVIGDLQSNSYILRVTRDNSGGGSDQTFDLDAWGSALIREAPDGGAGSASWTWVALDGTDVIKIDTALKAIILKRLNITAITSPADGDVQSSTFGFWFDDTDGAAAPQWKGKSADGTVVSGSLGGSGAAATDPGDIADPTLATAEDVALKLNTLMAEMRTAGMLV